MKKIFFSLIAKFMISAIGFANTIEFKNELNLETETEVNLIQSDLESGDDILVICYEMSRTTVLNQYGVYVTTIKYKCFKHDDTLGTGTVYIDAN